jgi:putative endonuclease
MFFVYILYSDKIDKFYIGFSKDPNKRLLEKHNKGLVKATKNGAPYKLLKTKSFDSSIEARKEERRLKKMKNRKYIIFLINNHW